MANWETLIAQIHSAVKQNASGEITGLIMQQTLDAIVNTLGATSGFKGVATPTTVPAATDGTMFYLANQAGTYTNFGGLSIARPGVYVLEYKNGSWSLKTVYQENDVSIQPFLNGTENISLSGNVLTFGLAGFTLLVGNRKYLISGNSDYTFYRIAATRGFLYFNLDFVKDKADGYAVNWSSTNPFVVSNENLASGNYHLIASYYAEGMFINDKQLGYYLNYKSIVDGLNFPIQNKIYQQFGKLFCSALPQVYVTVDTASNTITIPTGFSVIGLTSKTRYTTTSDQTCTIIPVNLSGVAQISTLGILLFDTSALTFKTLLYSETQPANTLVVGIVRRSELSSTKVGDVYIWGLENYKIDGVIKGSANNIIDRNRDVENLVLGAIAPKNNSQRYTFAHISDIHGQVQSITNLATYVNNYPVHAVINTGDLLTTNGGTIPSNILQAIDCLKKPYYPCIGNHDKGNGFPIGSNLNNTEVYTNYIEPFLTQDGTSRIPSGQNYYYIDNTTYKIRSIFLNEFDNDYIYNGSTDYAVSRGYRCFSQTQINWFIARLLDCPADYHIMISLHQSPFYLLNAGDTNLVRTDFSYQGVINYQPNQTNPDWMLPRIMDAYLNNRNLSGAPLSFGFVSGSLGIKADALSSLNASYTVTVNTNFSSVTPCPFIGYFCGHSHADIVAKMNGFGGSDLISPSQNIIAITTGNSGVSYSSDDDLPRISNTKSQDAFNICTVDKTNRKLYIVRVGSNTGQNLLERKYTILSY